jgi:hypothetical protein
MLGKERIKRGDIMVAYTEREDTDYDRFVKKKLGESPLIRHLFARLNTEVIVQTTQIKVRGILRTIDISYRWLEIDAVEPMKKTFFLKWDWIVYVESEHSKKITGDEPFV